MNRRLIATAMAVAVSVLGTQAAYALPHLEDTPIRAAVGAKVKQIKFSVRNDSSATVRFKAGDQEISLAPGKTTEIKVANGAQVISLEAQNREPGSVIATVSDALSGNTLVLR